MKKSTAGMQDEERILVAPLSTPTDLKRGATKDIAGAMNAILADVFALYLKTKNFHWHMSGPHFRDYHLLLDEQADQIFAMTDPIAERIRKVGGTTLRSIGHIAKLQRIKDNDADYVDAQDMLAELREDNSKLRTLQAEPASDPTAVEQTTQQVKWAAEVFQDRRQALGYACDVPSKIEQRLFALAHQIQQELE